MYIKENLEKEKTSSVKSKKSPAHQGKISTAGVLCSTATVYLCFKQNSKKYKNIWTGVSGNVVELAVGQLVGSACLDVMWQPGVVLDDTSHLHSPHLDNTPPIITIPFHTSATEQLNSRSLIDMLSSLAFEFWRLAFGF